MIYTAIFTCLAALGFVLLAAVIAGALLLPMRCPGVCVIFADQLCTGLRGIRGVQFLRRLGLLSLPIYVVDVTMNGRYFDVFPKESGITVLSMREWDEFLVTERIIRANGNGRDPAGYCGHSDLSK